MGFFRIVSMADPGWLCRTSETRGRKLIVSFGVQSSRKYLIEFGREAPMKITAMLSVVTALVGGVIASPWAAAAPASTGQITILYDAFGKDASMKKDWGFSALIEFGGKRILFDTGNNSEIFAGNVKAKNVDLTKIDFVILSHRHGDHMAGLSHVLSVNPNVKIYAPKEG